jgi:hypothetical protein
MHAMQFLLTFVVVLISLHLSASQPETDLLPINIEAADGNKFACNVAQINQLVCAGHGICNPLGLTCECHEGYRYASKQRFSLSNIYTHTAAVAAAE